MNQIFKVVQMNFFLGTFQASTPLQLKHLKSASITPHFPLVHYSLTL